MGNRRMDSVSPNGLGRRISSTSYIIRAVGELKVWEWKDRMMALVALLSGTIAH